MATRNRQRQGSGTRRERLATGLAVFSVGIGLAEIVAPRRIARISGLKESTTTVRVLRGFGLREFANGIALLIQPDAPRWRWARVGGDALDLAYLGRALASSDTQRSRALAATVAVGSVTAADIVAAFGSGSGDGGTGIEVRQAVTVNRTPEELYRYWRNFENLPRFMTHLESVQQDGDRRSHWTAKGPAGVTVEWDAEITEDRPNERIAWRSSEDADVGSSGSVRFSPAPGGRGTEVLVEMTYTPPGGSAGAAVAKLFGEEPQTQTYDDMRRFKQMMETGEIVRSDAGPEGTSIHQQMMQRPAQPQG